MKIVYMEQKYIKNKEELTKEKILINGIAVKSLYEKKDLHILQFLKAQRWICIMFLIQNPIKEQDIQIR